MAKPEKDERTGEYLDACENSCKQAFRACHMTDSERTDCFDKLGKCVVKCQGSTDLAAFGKCVLRRKLSQPGWSRPISYWKDRMIENSGTSRKKEIPGSGRMPGAYEPARDSLH